MTQPRQFLPVALGRLSEGSRNAVIERLGPEVLEAWSKLPLVIRGVAHGKGKSKVVVDIAPPNPVPSVISKRGGFLRLDLSAARQTLTLVIFDWDTLVLDAAALHRIGIDPHELSRLLQAASVSTRVDAKQRWAVALSPSRLEVRTGFRESSSTDLSEDEREVSPIVGRIRIGEVPWTPRSGTLTIEVLALPRLSPGRPTAGTAFLLGADEKAALDFLARTAWRRGAPSTLLALLRLAHDAEVNLSEPVTMSTSDDPSPLVWLTLAHALEAAALYQRRQYTRLEQTARAPVGTLRFNAYIANLARLRPEEVPVSRYMLNFDTLENRLFRGVASLVRRSLPNEGPDSLAAWAHQRFSALEDQFFRASEVEPAAWMCRALLARELPEALSVAVQSCALFLADRYPGLAVSGSGAARSRGFEVVISDLFERAMRRVAGQSLGTTLADGNDGMPAHVLRWTGKGTGSNTLKPDFAHVREGEVRLVGDAKYKGRRSQSSYSPLGREDFHQLATYLLAWPSARRGLVLMPAEEDELTEGHATALVATLAVGEDRELAVFKVSPSRWNARRMEGEPLVAWLRRPQPLKELVAHAAHQGEDAQW